MENKFDYDSLYLYKYGYNSFKVGKVTKINEKSIRMDSGTKIAESEYKYVHKLTEEESKMFKMRLVVSMNEIERELTHINDRLLKINNLLNYDSFIEINKDKFNELYKKLIKCLEKAVDHTVVINNIKYGFEKYSENTLKEIKEDEK